MSVPRSPDPFDLIPDPAEVHRHIAATARVQRLLRALLRLALRARRERELVQPQRPGAAGADRQGVSA